MRSSTEHELVDRCKKYVSCSLPLREISNILVPAVQGAGGGALLNVANIVISDLVPLRERPLYNSITGV